MTEESSPRGIGAVIDVFRRAFRPHRPPLTVWDVLEPEPDAMPAATPTATPASRAEVPARESVGV